MSDYPGIEYYNKDNVDNNIYQATETKSIKFKNITNFDIGKDILNLKLDFLEINNCTKNLIPNIVFSITSLTKLYLFNNELTYIPDTMTQLVNLTELSFSGNKLESIPLFLFDMTQLKKLALCNNPITVLPTDIAKLTNLQEFLIDRTLISTLSDEITSLKLCYFFCNNTRITNLSDNINLWTQSINCYRPNNMRDNYLNQIRQKYGRQIIPNIKLEPKKIVIKQSTIAGAGEGVFADEDIPANTIFYKTNPTNPIELDIYQKINDLAWHGDPEEYLNVEHLDRNINIITATTCHEMQAYILGEELDIYLKSLKDIVCGEELSRIYGIDYWLKNRLCDTDK